MKGLKALNREISKRHYENIEGLKAEISHKSYFFLLEVLPPVYTKKGFLLMEPLTHTDKGALNLHVWKENKKYYAEVVARRDWVAEKDLIEAGMI